MLETRTNEGFNKSEMARQLGIASQLYGQYERGEVAPKTDFRKKFEEKFGVSLIDIEDKISNNNVKTADNTRRNTGLENEKYPLSSQSTKNQEDMLSMKLMEILDRVTRTDEQHAQNYNIFAETIAGLRNDAQAAQQRTGSKSRSKSKAA